MLCPRLTDGYFQYRIKQHSDWIKEADVEGRLDRDARDGESNCCERSEENDKEDCLLTPRHL